jgi:hypothetical protein
MPPRIRIAVFGVAFCYFPFIPDKFHKFIRLQAPGNDVIPPLFNLMPKSIHQLNQSLHQHY